MGYFQVFDAYDLNSFRDRILHATRADVERALSRNFPEPEDLPALFSPAADSFVEHFARQSAAVTLRRFGNVIQLYAPLYLSNECVNHCVYCGFAHNNEIRRITLSPGQAADEVDVLYREGFRHILIVSGESPKAVGYHYLTSIIRELHRRFASISLEIYPLDTDGYSRMGEAGADGLTLYQETYDTRCYKEIHPRGPKRDFAWRMDAQDRAGEAGYRTLGIGALLGLHDWRFEALMVALHARYLTKKFWRSRIAVSFPRIRKAHGGFNPARPVSDRDVVHMMAALRIILPDAEFVVSTREEAAFRDNLIGLGVTRMSAGSKTSPGGYCNEETTGEQFAVEDTRSPAQVAQAILAKGCEPVWKDFDREFL